MVLDRLPHHDVYPIVETFHSVQGEGAWAGVNAFFIRLGGCDVFCPWCDQKETWNARRYPALSVQELAHSARSFNPAIVVVTGGEPLLYDLIPLTRSLHQQDLRVHLETSGSHPFSGEWDWVTLSPKPYKPPHESAYSHASELKVVICDRADLDWAEEQAGHLSPGAIKYLQPEWSSPASQALIFDYVLQHPDWRISLQTHKFINVR